MSGDRDGSFKLWEAGIPFVGKTKTGETGLKFWANGLPSVTLSSAGGGGGGGAPSFPALTLAP